MSSSALYSQFDSYLKWKKRTDPEVMQGYKDVLLASLYSSLKQCQSLWGTIKGHSNMMGKGCLLELWWELFVPLPLAFQLYRKRSEVSGFRWHCMTQVVFLFFCICFVVNTACEKCVNIGG